MWPPHNPITYSPLYGGRISSYLCKYMLSLDMAQDSTMTGSWLSWWYLSWSRASPASNGPGATLSWQGCFQSQGQSTSHLSSCFPLPRLPSQDFFRIVTSHIWHRSIFGGAACAIRSIPGKLLRPCQPSISLCQRTNYFTFSISRLDVDTFADNSDLWCCVCVMGTIMDPLRGNKAALKEWTYVLARQTIMQGKGGGGQHLETPSLELL